MSLHSELQTLGNAVNALLSVLGGSPAQPPTPPVTPAADKPAPKSFSFSSPAPATNRTGHVSVEAAKLKQLVNMTRRFVRYSREGNIPSKEQRKYARRAIKAVKHLLPPSDVRQAG